MIYISFTGKKLQVNGFLSKVNKMKDKEDEKLNINDKEKDIDIEKVLVVAKSFLEVFNKYKSNKYKPYNEFIINATKGLKERIKEWEKLKAKS